MDVNEFVDQINAWGRQSVPFLFLVDFELEQPQAWRADQVDADQMLYSLNSFSNTSARKSERNEVQLKKYPPSFREYEKKFNRVYEHLARGDSFLVNLTIRSGIELNCSTKDLFYLSDSRYKCWMRDQFLFYSPEIFVQIKEGKIFSYPMKGTIDASLENARESILQNKKEQAEHITIVDLIRNDLSRVATNVKISRFRYVEQIVTNDKKLLQVSSEIVGDLPADYPAQLGTILISLLPAGSVSGAPKTKTCQIIKDAEEKTRGFYTGVFGYFDGKNVDSCVAIRFVEQEGNQLYYRSGGGITAQSQVEEEYAEVIQKIYVPVA
jgi:para-aminobenzoate synthetase component 1